MQIDKLTAEIDGQQLHYLRVGTGSPLILLHGFLGGSFCWRMNMEMFSRQRTVGAIAMFLAAQSGTVRSMVLAAPVNPWSSLGAKRIRFLASLPGRALLRTAWPISRSLHRTALKRMYGDHRRVPEGTIEGYSSLAMRPGRVHNILSSLRGWEKDVGALRTAIPLIKARSLLIWGTRDAAVDPRSAGPLQRALPRCELALIEGAGHLTFEETPDEFNRLVLDFIDQP